MDAKTIIAKRVAKEFSDGDFINLGIGIPTMVVNFLPENITVTLHSENGFIGLGPTPEAGKEDKDISNAGGQPSSILPGGMFFDSSYSFGLVRGGHLDATVLGALQVDQEGNLANWMIPGKMVPGMGGAMDLVVGAKRVILAMEHTAKGNPKILPKCTLPLTASECVDMIVTEMAVFEIKDKKMVLTERAENVSLEDIKAVTPAEYTVASDLKVMAV
ncbi:MAG: 3-oxoacid CoA-transferase subunit B [Mucispirillum sp.]|nr:3-oxoacid CoA-transferase subunit B [Mucispirillum sp.]